ncbi:putative phage holin [Mycolicibacterium goodii]|uniref:putative phage holin n=1 Tax=Mycolicibacterium goodii TaxID=134601 RepID=UPI001BDBDCD9|nr:hypothetical protein [Mycolicibacterium goodii]MBU8831490.1 hypothetical protein [Mycolicibacterium goodii]
MRWVYLVAVAGIAATLAAGFWYAVDYELAANVSLIYVAVLSTVFAFLYGFRSRWWINRIGKVYLVQSALFSLVLIQVVVATWWDSDYPFRQQIRFVIYSLGAVALMPMILTLRAEQARGRRERAMAERARRRRDAGGPEDVRSTEGSGSDG